MINKLKIFGLIFIAVLVTVATGMVANALTCYALEVPYGFFKIIGIAIPFTALCCVALSLITDEIFDKDQDD